MSSLTIYHNPRCSKSRETLALLEEKGLHPEVIDYLKNPPTPAQLQQVLQALGLPADKLLRTKEEEYRNLNLANFMGSEQELITIMCEHPKLIERPIVVCGEQARIGRPPAAVLEIIKA